MKKPAAIRLVICLGIFAFVAVILYWTTWFLAPEFIQARSPSAADYQIYVSFEQAFLLGDAWLALSALIGSIGLYRMRPWGFLFLLLSGSAAIFLGLMDLLYDLQHAVFIPLTTEAVIELVIVVLLLSLGPLIVILLWRNRHLFFRGGRDAA